MEAVSAYWLALAGEVALKSVALMALAGIALILLRKSSADRRAIFWGCVLASFFLLPVLCLSLRGHEIALRFPVPDFAGSSLSSTAKSYDNDPSASFRSAASADAFTNPLATAISSPAKSASSSLALSSPPIRPSNQFRTHPFDAGDTLFGFWLLGFGWTMASSIFGWIGLSQARRRFHAVSDEALTRVMESISASWGLKREIRILVSRRPNSPEIAPMTWGFFHPVILLPEAALEWPESRLRMTLLHETAHISRGDWLARTLSRTICAIYWCHPFIWIAARRHRIECDRACDDLVLSAGIRGADYAYCLLETLQAMKNHRKLAQASLPMALRSQIETRLVALLDSSVSRKSASRSFRAISYVAALTLLTGAAVVKVSAQSASIAPKKAASLSAGKSGTAKMRKRLVAKKIVKARKNGESVLVYNPKTGMKRKLNGSAAFPSSSVILLTAGKTPATLPTPNAKSARIALKSKSAPSSINAPSADVADADDSAIIDIDPIDDKNVLDRRLTDAALKRIMNPLDEKKARLTHLFLDLEKNKSQVSRLDEKYKAGIITTDQFQDAKTKGSHLEIDIKTVQDQIQRLEKAGYGASGAKSATMKSSPSDDALRQHLMIEVESCRDELNQLQSKYKAGIIPSDDLTDTQYRLKHLELDLKLMSDH